MQFQGNSRAALGCWIPVVILVQFQCSSSAVLHSWVLNIDKALWRNFQIRCSFRAISEQPWAVGFLLWFQCSSRAVLNSWVLNIGKVLWRIFQMRCSLGHQSGRSYVSLALICIILHSCTFAYLSLIRPWLIKALQYSFVASYALKWRNVASSSFKSIGWELHWNWPKTAPDLQDSS